MSSAVSNGFALYIHNERDSSGPTKMYTLYDPNVFLKFVQKAADDADENDQSMKFKVIKSYLYAADPGEFVLAHISVAPSVRLKSPCWGAAEVASSASNSGFGPLLYDIAMSDYGVLTPDRISVSRSAYNVWDFYKNKRPDVEKLEFDDVTNPQTPPKEDDCHVIKKRPSLNYAYKIKNGVNYDPLVKNHSMFIKRIIAWGNVNSMLVNPRDIEEMIALFSMRFFEEMYENQ